MGNYIVQARRADGVTFVRDGYADPVTTTTDVNQAQQWVSEGAALIKSWKMPAAEGWNVVELDAAAQPINLVVERDDDGLYVDVERTRFRGDDLPDEGTWILIASTFSDEMGRQVADIEWSGDTPSGRCRATVQEP